ncbi:MAG TPA: response regulator [Candidatus Methylomirabilis sp.]|nr:response regulator [Candidatus Methylomirabilis sp.]
MKSFRRRVLVVDDNAAIRDMLAMTLAEEGFEVEGAADGADALDKLTTATYDVVLSDLQMPRLDGLSLLREIRRKEIGIPVIIQTASVDAFLETILCRAGAFRVLSKGCVEELLQALEEAIGFSRPSLAGCG